MSERDDSEGAEAAALERAAATELAEARAQEQALHLPGARAQYRGRLERAIDLATEALRSTPGRTPTNATRDAARLTLVAAHAARARDARHGASQLSQGSQRAPTREDCEDGWRRVESIVENAEASATEAARIAAKLNTPEASRAADAAQVAARDARRIVEQRNHAYTFHADPGFSFGEGWYLAAAAVLADLTIQIQPERPQTAQAERFLRDAGLGAKLVPYRSRPRANKALPEIVARAFRADPHSAQQQLRAAFLGAAAIPEPIVDWTDRKLAHGTHPRRVLVWVRHAAYQPGRNSLHSELRALCTRALARDLEPVLVGDAPQGEDLPAGTRDLTLFWKLPIFQGADMRRAQLQLFEQMKRAHGLVGQIGVTTAGMDGPALMGLATMYLTDAPNVRLGRWVGAVPGYEEIVRAQGYLERVDRGLQRWTRDRGV